MAIMKANYENEFPKLSVVNDEGADWDTWVSYIKPELGVAYRVTTHDGEVFEGNLRWWKAEEPFPAGFTLWDEAAGDYVGNRVVISLTEIKELAVL